MSRSRRLVGVGVVAAVFPLAYLLSGPVIEWDEIEAVQILESEREIRVLYEIDHNRWFRFGLATLPPTERPIEQGLVILRPGRDPERHLLKLVPGSEQFPDLLLQFHPNTSAFFAFEGAFYLCTGPSLGGPLRFFVLEGDRFVPVDVAVDRAIRRKIGIGPGPRERAPASRLDRLSEQAGWHYVPSNPESGGMRPPQFWFEPVRCSLHHASFSFEYGQLSDGPRVAEVLQARVGRGKETRDHVLARVKDRLGH